MIWKDFFFFSKGEKNGMLVLGSLICLMFAVNFCFPIRSEHQNKLYSEAEQRKIDSLIAEIRYRDSLLTKGRDERNFLSEDDGVVRTTQKRSAQQSFSQGEQTHGKYVHKKPVTMRINLNRADSAELVKLYGIGPVLSKRIIKYRNSLGGKFQSVDQLKNVYGLSEETFNSIKPYLIVDTLSQP
jgi:competence ComEA-like helix-hairpin-helix protein